MSKESVVEFLKKLQSDESLQQKLSPEGMSDDDYAAALVSAGAAAGHEFTAEECMSVVDAVHAYHAAESEELGEAELEKAAGGLGRLDMTAKKKRGTSAYSSLGGLLNTSILSRWRKK